MIVAVEDLQGVVLAHLEYVVAMFRMSVALRFVESVVVYLRLRVMMGWIARPSARKRYDLSQYELRSLLALMPGMTVNAEDRPNNSPATAANVILAAVFDIDVRRFVHLWTESSFIRRPVERDLGVLNRQYLHGFVRGAMHASRKRCLYTTWLSA